jgi:DNA-binding MurR/RpiR family transcriptional regulator
VAPATLSRLSHALGLADFDAMRRPVAEALARSASAVPLLEPPSAPAGAGDLAKAQQRNLASVAERNSEAAVASAAAAVLAARRVAFLGLRASHGIAHHLRYACDWLRPNAWLLHDLAGALVDQVAELRPDDLLVAVSQAPYTRQTVEMVQQAQAAGVPVLALTDSPLSPLARAARWVLLFDAGSPSFFHSMTGAQALAERLVAEVAASGGEAVVQRLRQVQARQHTQRAYWEKRPFKETFT